MFLLFMEDGAWFEGEVVEGEVGDGDVFELGEGVFPRGNCLAGKFVHEVDGDVGDARCSGHLDGFDCFLSGVEAAEGFEEGIVKGLYADADAVDAGFSESFHFLERDVIGICLECDFART